jgi:outer membrane lipoprotein
MPKVWMDLKERRDDDWKMVIGSSDFLVAGCAPVISQNVLRKVDKDLSFQIIQRNPDDFRGRTVLLGGKIIETIPLPGRTRIIVLQHTLGYRDRPLVDEQSSGRFIVEAQDFLDPFVFGAGRQVTVAGILAGKETKPLGAIEYVYPIVASRELYLWPPENPSDILIFHFGIGAGKTFRAKPSILRLSQPIRAYERGFTV